MVSLRQLSYLFISVSDVPWSRAAKGFIFDGRSTTAETVFFGLAGKQGCRN